MRSTQEILELERTLLKLENLHASFDYLRISIASPKRIKSWAQRTLPSGEIVGEVIRPETVNFRTHQPELYGLFCEKIFGPIKNWKCRCGKYNGFAFDKICDECEVEITEARVRRYRMGYIELTCPIAHIWYVKGVPNYLAILLKVFDTKLVKCTAADISRIVYFQESRPDEVKINKQGIVVAQKAKPLDQFKHFDTTNNELDKFLTKNSLEEKKNSNGTLRIQKRKGSEIIKAALESINIRNEIKQIRSFLDLSSLGNLRGKHSPDKIYIRRIRILESFLATKTNPSWMVLTTLPVLPPNLRPLVELESGRLVTADANEIYRLIITRNQRLFDFLYRFIAPDLISIQGRKLLQESIDSLIDNSRVPKNKRLILNNKPLRSLTTILEGKPGRFRQSLLGKRVDYSGRSVIIVGPNLRLNQCGLPYEMAIELFQPFLINALLKTKIKAPSHNIKLAHIIIKKNKPFIWTLLERLTRKHCILLNRAPTLHRFGIQAFDPVTILGQAIHLHPLVCTGFNADFDGDQMAVHLPLYESSQLEARTMMRPSYNVLSPSNGEVILKPTQDMVIGCYYLTLMIRNNNYIIKTWFSNEENALSAFYQKKLTIHTPILIRYSILNFKIKIENKKLIFADTSSFLNSKEIFIHKVFPIGNKNEKYYLITSVGILIVRKIDKQDYQITDLFLETTPGRLIFSINFKNLMKQ
jgi:DNA-directed RNA polymerase subunit beta'|tara:strand:- start:712 stop:2808 length:2097 start_codon:yes stop_codon:yes gene_type:complete